MSDEVTLTATVRDYIPNAMRDEFDNGTFQQFDAVKLHVMTPPELVRDLTIYHAGTIDGNSPWRRVGRNITADVKIADLDSHVLFDGAFRNLRPSPD